MQLTPTALEIHNLLDEIITRHEPEVRARNHI